MVLTLVFTEFPIGIGVTNIGCCPFSCSNGIRLSTFGNSFWVVLPIVDEDGFSALLVVLCSIEGKVSDLFSRGAPVAVAQNAKKIYNRTNY